MTRVRAEAAAAPNVVELSMDAKAVVKVGEFSRDGVSRVLVFGLDHDYGAHASVTPYGILLTAYDEMTIYVATGPVTADFIVDQLEAWWLTHRARFPQVDTLLLLQDNGPENQSRRTQYLYRLVDFAARYQLNIRLAYYPPYHSKYNPVERCWGILEQHWNGALLDTVETVLRYAATMTWRGVQPIVHLITKTYEKGVALTRAAMTAVEDKVQRLANLEPWFVEIAFAPKPGSQEAELNR